MSLKRALNIADLRDLARQRLPRMVFDYIDGGAEDEITLNANRARLSQYRLRWNALVDVSTVDLSTSLMGTKTSLPFLISPTAASRLFHPREGERAVARAAQKAGMIYSISTIGSVSIEEIAKLSDGPKWFQVYVWRDKSLVEGILDRVRGAGFTGLILTVDVPVAGNRERDPRNDFTIPPRITPRTVTQMLTRPGYLWDVATTPTINPANFPDQRSRGGIIEFINSQFDTSVTWDYAKWLKEAWGGPLAIKGISHGRDAVRAIEAGADAVWVSNHGGRQLDTAPATIDTLDEVVQAVAGRAEVIFDGGVRRGSDIAKALTLGASGVAIGRAYLYGLAAAGEPGVEKAIDILRDELERTLRLMGCPQLNALDRRLLDLPAMH
ncbi:MAG: alpha-hydroxy-acid oxidizing protein [Hyphomonadaceae bacterium]|nr:alpha-hydroxy-acid oxidizing protein [Hyphomonadaceae bacterium]